MENGKVKLNRILLIFKNFPPSYGGKETNSGIKYLNLLFSLNFSMVHGKASGKTL